MLSILQLWLLMWHTPTLMQPTCVFTQHDMKSSTRHYFIIQHAQQTAADEQCIGDQYLLAFKVQTARHAAKQTLENMVWHLVWTGPARNLRRPPCASMTASCRLWLHCSSSQTSRYLHPSAATTGRCDGPPQPSAPSGNTMLHIEKYVQWRHVCTR